MLIPNKTKRVTRESREAALAKHAVVLPDEALDSLCEFAEFLVAKYPAPELEQAYVSLPRPQGESVIAAIRRLSKSYPMLDKTTLFDQTSAAMSAHILQDISAEESIDKLETVFREKYQAFVEHKKT